MVENVTVFTCWGGSVERITTPTHDRYRAYSHRRDESAWFPLSGLQRAKDFVA